MLLLIGRILWVAVVVGAGMGHITQTRAMAGYAESKKVPNAKLMVQVTGVFLIATSLMVAFGVFADLAFLVQAVYLVVVAVWMHDFWKAGDPQAAMAEQTQFMKNISLAGAALSLFVFYGLGGGAGIDFTITDSLFELGL